jgi:hypothetical protein
MLANLRALLGMVADIIRLKGGPENLPASAALLACVVAVFAGGTAIAAASVATADQQAWPIEVLVGIVVTLGWFHVALGLAKKRERFIQTMTALFAVRAIFTPALIPMLAGFRPYFAAAADAANTGAATPHPAVMPDPPGALAALVLFLMIWLLVIEVRIIRAAFEWPTAGALFLVLTQEFAVAVVYGLLLAFTTG